jgi:hypothetical protein
MRPGGPPGLQGGAKVSHVDVHVHLIGGREKVFGDAVEHCVATMEESGIARAVVMSPPQAPPGVFDAHDFAAEVRRHGKRFVMLGGGGILNPMLHAHHEAATVTPEVRQGFIDEANRLLDAGAVGFGEIAVLHVSLMSRHPFEQVASAHPLMEALAEVAGRRKAVIDLHMDAVAAAEPMRTPPSLKVPPNPPALAGNVAGLEGLLAEHPGARIVWAHGGSDMTGNQSPALIGRLMDAHANLFMSLRPVPPQANAANPFGLHFYNLILTPSGVPPDWLALLRRHPDRFVMGSDSFFVASAVDPDGAPASLARGNQGRLMAANAFLAKLPPDLRTRIAMDNPSAIYRI